MNRIFGMKSHSIVVGELGDLNFQGEVPAIGANTLYETMLARSHRSSRALSHLHGSIPSVQTAVILEVSSFVWIHLRFVDKSVGDFRAVVTWNIRSMTL